MHESNNLSERHDPSSPLRLGISACLLGQKVRYDGGHKQNYYLTDTLGPFVEWTPVCPEMEIGLGIPREPLRLVGTADNPRLITQRTHIDHTEAMLKWAAGRIHELDESGLCGFILKSRSPSCGIQSVRIYNERGMPGPEGAGIWARALMELNPLLPVVEVDQLQSAFNRENFIERVFDQHRCLKGWPIS